MSVKKVLTGNYAAAEAAALCRPDLVAAYPITPQSSVVEHLAEFISNGLLDAAMVQVESEHSAMSVVQGASAGGGRVFTATSAQGLALMYEPYFRMSTLRLPMVMAIATREMTSPETVWSGQQDAMSMRDAGWIQVFCENNQEIIDMVIQGYLLAEDKRVMIPVNVCYDGFYGSHLTEGVELPSQEEVDAFLPPMTEENHPVLDPDHPFALDPLTAGPLLMKYRKDHLDAMEQALFVIDEIDRKFAKAFGRSYGGAIEEYRCGDAEVVIVTIGGMSGTGKDAVDIMREKGVKAGLIKLRFIRPFPAARIADALAGKKAFCVVDRSVCFGWSQGPMYMETKAALADLKQSFCHFSAIGGLGGADISLMDLLEAIQRLEAQKDQPGEKETLWFMKG
ncbi:MAG: phenylglyoxylate dehydrogenase [Oscillibacter sp.]|jgi:phenylglyoxylate dehydrogenase alpha subunit|nr:phenylglyoxylate dehydrogenase [Oscillibacter sp.]MCI9002022.1 phenylglyoxylate dehydrogenase [Oscillibacter sp.]